MPSGVRSPRGRPYTPRRHPPPSAAAVLLQPTVFSHWPLGGDSGLASPLLLLLHACAGSGASAVCLHSSGRGCCLPSGCRGCCVPGLWASQKTAGVALCCIAFNRAPIGPNSSTNIEQSKMSHAPRGRERSPDSGSARRELSNSDLGSELSPHICDFVTCEIQSEWPSTAAEETWLN
jgi:hypothetical protein